MPLVATVQLASVEVYIRLVMEMSIYMVAISLRKAEGMLHGMTIMVAPVLAADVVAPSQV
jgi:hypothetical protein